MADEPGAWSPIQGRRLWDAMVTSLGKRKTQILAVGTLAPAPLTGPASWWPSLVASGSGDGRHVSLLQADPEKWGDFEEVLRVNPVAAVNPYLKQTPWKREHRAALASERAARTFRQYRLNIPGDPVDSQPLVTTAEWGRVVARPVPACEGKSDYRRRFGRQSQLVCGVRRLAEWPNRGMGACAGSPFAGRSGTRRPGSARLLLGVGDGGRV